MDKALDAFRFLLWTELLLVPGLEKPPLNGKSNDTPPDDFSPMGRLLSSGESKWVSESGKAYF